jgi:hypothetical protein
MEPAILVVNRRLHQLRSLAEGSDFIVQFHRVDFLAGVRRHTVSTAETTDCAHTYHHAFGLQQKGRSTGVAGCPEGRKCAPAIQSLRSLARHPFCLNIYQKCVAEGKRPNRSSVVGQRSKKSRNCLIDPSCGKSENGKLANSMTGLR